VNAVHGLVSFSAVMVLGDVNTILANPLQIAVIALGVVGFVILYAGYLAVAALDDNEREEIRKKLVGLTGIERQLRAYALMNPKSGTRLLSRWRSRPSARRYVYLGTALLVSAIIAWRFVM